MLKMIMLRIIKALAAPEEVAIKASNAAPIA